MQHKVSVTGGGYIGGSHRLSFQVSGHIVTKGCFVDIGSQPLKNSISVLALAPLIGHRDVLFQVLDIPL